MRQLLNTLFVTSEDIYLSLDGENVVASREHQERKCFSFLYCTTLYQAEARKAKTVISILIRPPVPSPSASKL